MNAEENEKNGWKWCAEILEENHSASYIVKNDEGFTLLIGNSAFYRIFQTTEEHLRGTYGNRLGAFLDADSLKEIDSLINNYDTSSAIPICLKQRIKRNGIDAWVWTEITVRKIEGEAVFLCNSFDITQEVRRQQDFQSYEKAARFAFEQSNVVFFEYNCITLSARIFNADLISPEASTQKYAVCPDFVNHLIEKEIVCKEHNAIFRNAFCNVAERENNSVCEIQMKSSEGKLRWIRLTLTPLPSEKNDENIVGAMEDITYQKETTRSYLTETLFYQAMLAENDAYVQVDVTANRVARIGGLWSHYNEIIDKVSYSQLAQEYIIKDVHPDDQKQYSEIIQPENFIQSIENGINRLGCEFRRKFEKNDMLWMKLNVHLFREPLNQHVMALLNAVKLPTKKLVAPMVSEATQPLSNSAAFSKTDELNSASCNFDEFVSKHGELAYLVDADTFELICASQSFYSRIGFTALQCKGMKCYELMHKRKSPCPFCSKANWTADRFVLWKNLNVALGQELLIKNKLVLWQGKEVMLALAVDISNNKSIADSLENNATESHCILSGVQRMAQANSLTEAMNSVLEAIGCFFNADTVCFWKRAANGSTYSCNCHWAKNGRFIFENSECREVSAWLNENKVTRHLVLENPEAMLSQSYDMYQYMKQHGLQNQHWFRLSENDVEFGYISIENSNSNISNTTFLETISVFIASELKKRNLIENVYHANSHDEMTGLLSRNNFEEYMLHFEPDQVTNVAVVMANFNNLNGINSSYGFQTGNFYIKQFAYILCEVFPLAHIFRLNGDEFLIIADNILRLDWEKKIAQMSKMLQKEVSFSVSTGSAWDDTENNLSVLIEQATHAMKVNKKRYYDTLPDLIDAERRHMLVGLMAALERNEFEVFLQPKVELSSKTVVAAEALVRYRHKKLGIIQPRQFIGMLEQNNLIRYIDLFVFDEVCKQLERWKQAGLFVPVVSLNFSRLTLLEHDILASMEIIISRYSISKKFIEIEITESMVDMGKSILCQVAQDLYTAGYSVSLDDFGTKYTNLSLLADIDFSMLKIDKSLVDKLEKQSNYQIILKNIISMCKDLHMKVLAEGIETLAQEQILRAMGCLMGQGYLYGKPMPINAFEKKHILLRKPLIC